MGVDVGGREFNYVIRAFCADESSYLLACGEAGSFDEIIKIASTKFAIAGSKARMSVAAIFIDSGFEAKKTVYDLACKYYRKVWPMKGGKHAVPVGVKHFDWGSNEKRRIELTHYDDSTFKEHMYIDKIQRRELPGWYLPKNIPQQYRDHFGAEKLEEKDGKQEWVRTGANHYADCEKLLLVALAKYRSLFVRYRKQVRAAQQAAKGEASDTSEPRPRLEVIVED